MLKNTSFALILLLLSVMPATGQEPENWLSEDLLERIRFVPEEPSDTMRYRSGYRVGTHFSKEELGCSLNDLIAMSQDGARVGFGDNGVLVTVSLFRTTQPTYEAIEVAVGSQTAHFGETGRSTLGFKLWQQNGEGDKSQVLDTTLFAFVEAAERLSEAEGLATLSSMQLPGSYRLPRQASYSHSPKPAHPLLHTRISATINGHAIFLDRRGEITREEGDDTDTFVAGTRIIYFSNVKVIYPGDATLQPLVLYGNYKQRLLSTYPEVYAWIDTLPWQNTYTVRAREAMELAAIDIETQAIVMGDVLLSSAEPLRLREAVATELGNLPYADHPYAKEATVKALNRVMAEAENDDLVEQARRAQEKISGRQ